MAFNAGTVEGKLELNTRDFVKAVQRASKALDRIEENSKKAAKGMSGFRDKLALARDLIIVLPAAFKAVSGPMKKLVGFFKQASDAAAEFQKATSGLSTALQLGGVSGVGRVTQDLRKWASELQNVTHHSDGAILSVAELLVNMGVQQDQLKLATKATLDYATATGRNVVEAARQAAKTLGGSLGEMAESLPQLKALTQEQLKAGGAFQFMEQAFGGYSEAFAKTTLGMRAQFENAWGDLLKEVGSIINPVMDTLTQLGTESIKVFTKSLQDPAVHAEWVDWFRNLARDGIAALQTSISTLLNVPAFLAQGGVVIAQLVEKVKVGIAQVEVRWQEFVLRIRQSLFDFIATMPNGLAAFLGIDKTEAIKEMVGAVGEAQRAVAQANIDLEKARENGAALVNAAQDNVAEWRTWAEEMQQGDGIVAQLVDKLDDADQALKNMSTSANGLDAVQHKINVSAGNYTQQVKTLLEHYRAMNPELAGVVQGVQDAAVSTAVAADAAGTFVNEWGRAVPVINAVKSAMDGVAASGRAAAGAAGGIGGGGGGDDFGQSLSGQGDAFGRSKGGSAGFDLSNITGVRQAIAASQAAGRASIGGQFSRMARKSAGIMTRQLQARLQSMIDEQQAAFTQGIVDELNRAGIYDPARRQALIQQQLDEAKRLGTLPGSGGGSGTGGFLR